MQHGMGNLASGQTDGLDVESSPTYQLILYKATRGAKDADRRLWMKTTGAQRQRTFR